MRSNQKHSVTNKTLLPLAIIVLCMIFAILPSAASGHNGGEPRLVDVEAGDFRLSIWSLPVPLETGEVNFIAFVAESSEQGEFVRANSPVLDANIELTIVPVGGGDSIVIKPGHEAATNKLFYESYFELLDPGEYTATISVESEGKTGEADFTFEIAAGPIEINWFRYSSLALVAVAIGWFIWQVRQEQELREASVTA